MMVPISDRYSILRHSNTLPYILGTSFDVSKIFNISTYRKYMVDVSQTRKLKVKLYLYELTMQFDLYLHCVYIIC